MFQSQKAYTSPAFTSTEICFLPPKPCHGAPGTLGLQKAAGKPPSSKHRQLVGCRTGSFSGRVDGAVALYLSRFFRLKKSLLPNDSHLGPGGRRSRGRITSSGCCTHTGGTSRQSIRCFSLTSWGVAAILRRSLKVKAWIPWTPKL